MTMYLNLLERPIDLIIATFNSSVNDYISVVFRFLIFSCNSKEDSPFKNSE